MPTIISAISIPLGTSLYVIEDIFIKGSYKVLLSEDEKNNIYRWADVREHVFIRMLHLR